MKSKISIIIFIIISALFFYFYNNNNNNINGTIINIEDENIEIITDNDSIYKLNYKNINYKIGDYINIKYIGNINTKKNKQNIIIKEIKKETNKVYEKEAYNILKKMTLEEKIGQLLLVRVPLDNKIDVIKEYNIGGYILFQRDIDYKSKEEIISEIKDYQDNSKIPLLIAIDEEGGTVTRLSNNKEITLEPFLSSKELYKKGGYKLVEDDAKNKNKILTELGINMNLAPVADVVTNEKAYMYSRSFSENAKTTSKYIEIITNTQTKEVSYVLKHFPGYGNNDDTHTKVAIDNRSYKNIKKDLLPFKTGVKSGIDGILVSHNIVYSIEEKPCSLSINCHNVIRNELNFDGVVITDALDMEAVENYNTYSDAVLSGNNILIVTDYETAYNEIYNNVINGNISEELINRLVIKNLELKEKKELF